jgi:hypothetical protein
MTVDSSCGGKSGNSGGCGGGGVANSRVSETARMISGALED